MNIYGETNYRKVIKDYITGQKRFDSTINYQNMASAMGIQKAYLSLVVKGERDLSQDQLYRANQYMKFTLDQAAYMELLLEWSRCGVADRKAWLKKKIQEQQRQYLKTEKTLEVNTRQDEVRSAEEYYLDPVHQLIHVAMDIPRFKKNPNELADYFNVSPERIQQALQTLERMGVISFGKDGVEINQHNLHLARESQVFWAWKQSLNLLSMHKCRGLSQKDSYNFSVVFSADDEVKNKLHQLFLSFLKEAQGLVKQARSKNVYQMNFDLFNWTKK